MSTFQTILSYLRYRRRATTDYGLHSPFVFDFYTEMIRNKHRHYDFEGLDKLRAQLLNSPESLSITDLGAGSRKLHTAHRLVKDIARHGMTQKRYAELLFRIANKYAPSTIVELGTSLGLTTLYLAKARPSAQVYTIEGSEALHHFATKLFEQQHQQNIKALAGNFDTAFPALLKELNSFDLLFIDGNHAKEPTLRYFELALQKKHTGSIIIFDDIHWSEGMEQAWDQIRKHPEVRISIDLFYMGIVFFRKEQKEKEHFILK